MQILNPIRIFFLIFSCNALAQNNFYYPGSFNAYFLNTAQVSPASFPEEGKVELTSGYKSLTGAFRKVSSYNFTAAGIFRKNDKAHLIRLQFYNEKEGSYISSPRAYASYGYLLPLGERLSIFSAAAIGFAGLYYSAPNTTQSSYNVPDGSVGLGLKTEWYEFGGSVMQIFNSKYKPVASTVTLKRYYNIYATVKKKWTNDWFIKAYGLYRHMPSTDPDIILTGAFGYLQNLEAGVSIKYNSGLSLHGIFGVGIGEDKLKFLINYNSSFFGLTPKYQSNIEIGLSYLVIGKE